MMFIRREIQCKYHVNTFAPVFYDVFKINSRHFLFSEKKRCCFCSWHSCVGFCPLFLTAATLLEKETAMPFSAELMSVLRL